MLREAIAGLDGADPARRLVAHLRIAQAAQRLGEWTLGLAHHRAARGLADELGAALYHAELRALETSLQP